MHVTGDGSVILFLILKASEGSSPHHLAGFESREQGEEESDT